MSTVEELKQWHTDGKDIIENLPLPLDSKPSVFHWPTDYHYITRDYGARPDVYRGQIPRFLYHPDHWHDGHEGVDIRTGMRGKVYAIAPGKIYQVGWRKKNHAYGFGMRIQHEIKINGKLQKIRSVYAHLEDGSNLYQPNELVSGGLHIATADSTGNSTGDHLHLTLYWYFAGLGYRIVNPMWVLSL